MWVLKRNLRPGNKVWEFLLFCLPSVFKFRVPSYDARTLFYPCNLQRQITASWRILSYHSVLRWSEVFTRNSSCPCFFLRSIGGKPLNAHCRLLRIIGAPVGYTGARWHFVDVVSRCLCNTTELVQLKVTWSQDTARPFPLCPTIGSQCGQMCTYMPPRILYSCVWP